MGVIFAILWGILKWALLLLLGLLILILLIAAVFIFVPIRYRIQGEKSSERLQGSLRLTWLLHLLSLRVQYQEHELVWECRLGPKILAASYPLPQKKKKRRPLKQPPQAEKTTEPAAEEPSSAPPVIPHEEEQPRPRTSEMFSEAPKPLPAVPEEKPRQSKWHKIKSAVRRFWQKLIHPFQQAYHKLQRWRESWHSIKEKWEGYPQKAETARAVKELALGLLRPVLPRAYQLELLFGFDDPATTGKVLGYYYMLDPLLFPERKRRREIVVEADFQEAVLEGKGWCRGRFCVGSFLKPLIKALMNAHIRRLIRYIRAYQS
ncbi:MAG: DUF2953 domain-containing protein [Lachnospiraceae bacterium]|jgi:hypothetical protein|nr:DUF2953 domain-containing protein [Lachnospiraceae bacterium]